MHAVLVFPLVLLSFNATDDKPAGKHLTRAVLETPFYELSNLDATAVVAACAKEIATEAAAPRLAKLHEGRGDAHHVLGKYQDAVSDYEKALKHDPGNNQVKWKLARSLCGVGRADEGLRTMEKFVETNKKLSRPYLVLALILHDQGEYEKAYAYTKEAELANKDDPLIYWSRALCLFNMGRYDRAKEAVDHFVFLQPFALEMNYDDVYALRGRVYDKLGDYRGALSNFRMSQKLNPKGLQAGLGVTQTYLHMGHNELAYQAAQEVLRFAPEDLYALYAAATTAGAVGEDDAEAEYAKRALAIAPDDPEALLRAGTSFLKKKQYKKMAKCFDTSLRVNPDHVETLKSYALALAASSDVDFRNGKKALEMATRAVKLTKDDHEAMSIQSLAMAETEDFEGARKLIMKCLVLAEKDGDARAKARYSRYLEAFQQKIPAMIDQ